MTTTVNTPSTPLPDHHEHDHHGHDHTHAADPTSRAFKWSIILNSAYVLIELLAGFLYDSMGLVSDALHNLTDVASLLIALIAYRVARRQPNARYTYGYGNATVHASFVNALIIYIAVGAILLECIRKFFTPEWVNGSAVALVAGLGVIVNALTAWMLMRANRHDLNIKGAYMHMIADTLVSVGVVISGIVIHLTGWVLLDPLAGIVIAAIIAWTSRGLLRESFRLWLNGVPKGIDTDALAAQILQIPGVKEIHHLHVWALTTTVNAMTVHIVIADPAQLDTIIEKATAVALANSISHPTIQAETKPGNTPDHTGIISPKL